MFYGLMFQLLPIFAFGQCWGQSCDDVENTVNTEAAAKPTACNSRLLQRTGGTSNALLNTMHSCTDKDDPFNSESNRLVFKDNDEELFEPPKYMNEKHQGSVYSGHGKSYGNNEYLGLEDFLEQLTYLDKIARNLNEETRALFEKYLVSDESLELRTGQAQESKLAERALGICLLKAENAELERQIAEEARRMFYEKNTFVVWSGAVESFVKGAYGDDTSSISVGELVQRITIKSNSFVEIFEFLEHVSRKRRHLTMAGRVSLKVDQYEAQDGTNPGTLRSLLIISKILHSVIVYLIKQVVQFFVQQLERIGNMLASLPA